MAESNHSLNEAFDFSQDAAEFKEALWHRLQDMMDSSIQELEDDDLEFLNAAGTPFSMDFTDDIDS